MRPVQAPALQVSPSPLTAPPAWTATVTLYDVWSACTNDAVQVPDASALSVVAAPVPEQAPPQALKRQPAAGRAVSDTVAPLAMVYGQVADEQLDSPATSTVPMPVSCSVTVTLSEV